MIIDIPQIIEPLTNRMEAFIPRLPSAIATLLIGYLAIRILQYLLRVALEAAHATRAMQQILQSVFSVILWIGVIALVFQSLGLSQVAVALSGSAAIIGLGIAAGSNKLVADIIAGLFIAKSKDFKIGQRVKVGDIEGRVHSLDSRKVRILDEKGVLHIMPNAKFDEQTWQILPHKEDEKEKNARK